MDFSQRLKRIMDERHLTNYELAKKLDIHPTTVANWLDGSEPRKKTMAMLADFFGVSEEWLEGKDTKKEPTFIDGLDSIYLSIAKDAQENQIDPEDLKLAIETIKNLRKK